MVLTGDGGDELFAGYDKYRDFFGESDVSRWEEARFRSAYARNLSLFTPERLASLIHPGLAGELAGHDPYAVVNAHLDRVGHMDRINQALYLDMMLLLPGNNLVKPDRMGMAVSLEARTPFLDYRMMELAFRMPGRLKLHEGTTKYLLKKAVAPLIGETLAYRKKQMFTVPVGEWLKKDLAGVFPEFLLSERSMSRGLFTPSQVRTLFAEHQDGRRNHTRELRALIALELWMRIFMDGTLEYSAEALDFPDVASLGLAG